MSTTTEILDDSDYLPGDHIPIGFRRAEIRERNDHYRELAASSREEAKRQADLLHPVKSEQALRDAAEFEALVSEEP